MKEIIIIIGLPVLVGLFLFLIPDIYSTLKAGMALLTSIITGYLCLLVFQNGDHFLQMADLAKETGFQFLQSDIFRGVFKYVTFQDDGLSRLIVLFTGLFALLILLYSVVYMKSGRVRNYYPYFLITLGCAYGTILSDNLLLFLFFWGLLGITLYKLIRGENEESAAAAKKTLILIGASDSLMILGIASLWKISGTLSMTEISVPVDNPLSACACLALLAGSFTKAGAFPFHTWVPDYTKNAAATSSAWLPASLDKLLGIYFLARITTRLFILNEWVNLLLLTFGVITIIIAVMMALVQHNYKKLLGYHAVSQVGYMMLGFGLGSAIGIAAGLFHMINHALYKSGLFLAAGSVEYRTGKEEIGELGGLSRSMPLTFIAFLIFAMSISGVPPFNGFASKWMIYQGIIDLGAGSGLIHRLWVVWLGLAVLGSALTLASFIKLIGGIFLSRRKPEFEKVKEVPFAMWLPMLVLGLFCVLFGVFANELVIPELLLPVTGTFHIPGFWNSSLVSMLVILSILLGIILYLISGIKKFRMEDNFIGGEKIQDQTSFATTEFYKSLTEFRFLALIYKKAEEKWFDIYDIVKQSVLWLSHQLSKTHGGVLTGYIVWVFGGLIIMMFLLIKLT